MSEYEKIKELGRGTYGTVYLAKRITDDVIVAIKRLYTDYTKHNGILCLRELEMAITSRHPNLAIANRVIHGTPFAQISPRKKYRTDKIYLEFSVALCDLEYLLSKMELPPFLAHIAMKEISSGLEYLHSRGIMHRDIKPNNVLVYTDEEEEHMSFKLADFGAAKPIAKMDKHTPKLFYIEYRAPELLLKKEEYTFAPDVWALGCMFVEIVTGKAAFPIPGKKLPRLQQLEKIIDVLGTSPGLIRIAKEQEEKIVIEPKNVPNNKGLLGLVRGVKEKYFDSLANSDIWIPEWHNWFGILRKMLETDPNKRATMQQVVTTLGSNPTPATIVNTKITIRNCPCRTETLDLLKRCKLEPGWYDHCVDLVNRITYLANYNPKHLTVAVVSIVSKYWAIELAPKLPEMLPEHTCKSFRGKQLEDYELQLVRDVLEYTIHRPLLCDYLDGRVPRHVLREAAEAPASNGSTVEEVAARLLTHYSPKNTTDKSSNTDKSRSV